MFNKKYVSFSFLLSPFATTRSLFPVKYSLQNLFPQLARAIRGAGTKEKRKFYNK